MKRFWTIVGFLGFAALVAGAVVFFRMTPAERSPSARAQETARPARAGVPVETSKARLVRASDDIRTIGSLQSDESVKIAAEVPGRIAEVLFQEGRPVNQGDVLVKLDDALV